jgi:hypothetical protein
MGLIISVVYVGICHLANINQSGLLPLFKPLLKLLAAPPVAQRLRSRARRVELPRCRRRGAHR